MEADSPLLDEWLTPVSAPSSLVIVDRQNESAASISQIFRRCAFLGARGDSLVKVLTADGLQPSLVTFDGCRIDTGVNSARYGVYVKGRPGLTVRFENCMIAGGSGAGDGGGAKALIYANGGFIQIWACTLQNNKIASGSVPTGPDGEEIYLDVPQSMSDATNVNPGPSLTAMHCESQGPRFLARRFQRLLADGSGANAVSARNAPQNVVLINCNHADTLSGLLAANATKAGRPLPPMDPTPGSIFWEGGSIEEAGITYQESAASRLILPIRRPSRALVRLGEGAKSGIDLPADHSGAVCRHGGLRPHAIRPDTGRQRHRSVSVIDAHDS